MKQLVKLFIGIIACITLVSCSQGSSNGLTGAGSSFIYPVLSIWAKDYAKQGPEVNYQAIGSGGGLQQIYSKTIDFAASDMPLTLAQLKQHQLQQFPMIVGGIVPVVNITGVKNNQLKLNSGTLVGIYMGTIQYWDNKAIKSLNPGVKLPHNQIITIHRADGSGTTFNFSNYFTKVSSTWKSKYGANTVISWPGNGIGAKGNAGVASQVMQTPNSIGYVEYAYAKQNDMTMTKMQNRAGRTVAANAASFTSAAKNAKWTASNGFYQILTNQPGANSWPIVATTFVLIPKTERTPLVKQKVFKFFTWCFKNGTTAASQLDYVAIPKSVYKSIIATFK